MNFNTTPPTSRQNTKSPKIGKGLTITLIVLVVLIILFIALSPFVVVPAGHTGVVVTLGSVSDNTLAEGFHFKNPISNVQLMDVRTLKSTVTLQAFSKDIQQVDVITTVNFRVDKETAPALFKNVGMEYFDTVMAPRIQENTKAVFTKYTAEKITEARDQISAQVRELLVPEMAEYGITVSSVSIENVDFTDAFTDAVEAKQVAEQTKLKVETEQAQQVSVEKATAERRIIAANADAEEREILATADAEVAKIKADAEAYAVEVQAEAEAEANAKIAASITDHLIEYYQITNWDGKLPEIYSGGGALPILDLMNNNSTSTAQQP